MEEPEKTSAQWHDDAQDAHDAHGFQSVGTGG